MIQTAFNLIKKLRKNFSEKLFLVKVEELSAFPDLIPGRYYLAQKFLAPRIGQYIVFAYQGKILVKKLIAQNKNFLILQGKIGQEKYYLSKKEILGTLLRFSKFSL